MNPVRVGEDELFHLGDQYMVSVQKYNNAVRLQIRKYIFDKSRQTIRPTKEGISLRPVDIPILMSLPDDAIKKLKTVKAELESKAEELEKEVHATKRGSSSSGATDKAEEAEREAKKRFFPEWKNFFSCCKYFVKRRFLFLKFYLYITNNELNSSMCV